MKRFFDAIRDFIYDSIDYLIMFIIIGLVVFVIGWRINILFAEKPIDTAGPSKIESEEDNNIDENQGEEDQVEGEDTQEEDEEEDSNSTDQEDMVEVTIPSGSLSTDIGAILVGQGLIEDKQDFVDRSQSMGLDTKLKSGSFQIQSGSSLEEIIQIISR